MTDTSSLFITNTAAPPELVIATSSTPPQLNGAFHDEQPPQEEEDYTIKCICDYADDDGSTVFCEKCETWQHIGCYYRSAEDVPDVHFCVECQPRHLDVDHAKARLKISRPQTQKGGDSIKSKRTSTKTSKKKPKELNGTQEQVNGHAIHERHLLITNSRDNGPPHKRPKTSHHRSSGSVASTNGVGHTESRKRAVSNVQGYPSPTKSPPNNSHYLPVPRYTHEFLTLYENDSGKDNLSDTNYYNISVTSQLSVWRNDPLQSADASFITLDQPFDKSSFPAISIVSKADPDVEIDGLHPRWQLLQLDQDVQRNQPLGEVTGTVGTLDEYCRLSSRWPELRHPEPFVFFHPNVPIFIDSRHEGTKFRYIRRSCRPNTTLKTFIDKDGEFHFCFVASSDQRAGSELTTSWYIDQSLFQSGQGKDENVAEDEMLRRKVTWVSCLLANFGDCACGHPDCSLAKLDRRQPIKVPEVQMKPVPKKRKSKAKHTVSPLSTGRATNSRAGSENVKNQEDEEGTDALSTSGSSREKSQSREMTPIHSASLDADPMASLAMSAREKRKIAMAEAAFERAEQDHSVAGKKKKRTSAGSLAIGTATHGHSKSVPATPDFARRNGRLDPRNASGSPPPLRSSIFKTSAPSPRKTSVPTTNSIPIPARRPVYVDVAIQTDEEVETTNMPPPKRRRFLTPNQRLMQRLIADKARYDQRCALAQSQAANSEEPSVPTRLKSSPSHGSAESKDAEISDSPPAKRDVGVGSSPISTRSPVTSTSSTTSSPVYEMSPPYNPSRAAHSYKNLQPVNGQRLQLLSLPPVPAFPNVHIPTTPASATATPSSTTPSIAQSPFSLSTGSASYPGLSAMTAPSPVKKKLSLGDYRARRSTMATTPAAEKTESQAMGATLVGEQEPRTKSPEAEKHAQVPTLAMMSTSASTLTIGEPVYNSSNVPVTAIVDTPMQDAETTQPETAPTDPQPSQTQVSAEVLSSTLAGLKALAAQQSS